MYLFGDKGIVFFGKKLMVRPFFSRPIEFFYDSRAEMYHRNRRIRWLLLPLNSRYGEYKSASKRPSTSTST